MAPRVGAPTRDIILERAGLRSKLLGTGGELPLPWGERLSLRSSGLPCASVPEDGVEDGQKLARHRDDGDDLGLAGSHQAFEEGPQNGIVPSGHECAHEESGAHGGPPAAYRSEEHTSELQSRVEISY